ncbi:glycosyltransferase [Clavibacter michiganensis subsp. phaseoli]|uniref:Glycosyltransferase n=1 Tax=Clavibacter phaseoli TaxID=1734031 RepID=A0A8I0S597_9MICO|nr:glycosyltransferase [Clavibacter phaseoli]MBF4629722.1 glycosyltransferase [Clavibacter phaseoli]
MKILHIVPLIDDAASYGGPVRNTFRQSEAQVKYGHSVHVLSLWKGPGPRPTAKWKIPLVTFGYVKLPLHKLASLWSLSALLWVYLRASRYDVVHLHAGRDLWVLAAALVLRIRRVPYVWQTHGMLAPRSNLSMRLYDTLLTRPAVAGAASFMYLTPYEKRDLEGFAHLRRSVLIVNGVDSPAQRPPEGLSAGGLRVVFASRLHERKRAIDLVDAAAQLLSEGHDIEVDIYGPDEGALPALLKRIESVDATGKIRYSGALPYEAVRAKLSEFNTFVLPSVNEPFPNALLESLATGLASVCTTSCGLAPYVSQARAGAVVAPGPDGIARALRELALTPALRSEYAERGLELVRREFSMASIAQKMIVEYEEARK